MTLVSEKILEKKLVDDIEYLIKMEPAINRDILVLNYLTQSSLFTCKRVNLAVGIRNPITSNLYSFIIGESGCGKTFTSDLFTDIVSKISIQLILEYKEQKKFVEFCKNYKALAGIANVDKIPDADKISCVQEYNDLNDTYHTLYTREEPREKYIMVDNFTPEKFEQTFNDSETQCLLDVANEWGNLKTNFSRGGTVANFYEILTQYFEGKTSVAVRVSKEVYYVEDGKLSLIANTTPTLFEPLKSDTFFSSGLGYRFLFFYDKKPNLDDIPYIKRNENLNEEKPYEQFQNRIANIFDNYFFQKIYRGKTPPVNLVINDPANLKYFNECVQFLYNTHIKNNDALSISQKSSLRSRLHYMFTKVIINIHMINYSYANENNWGYFEDGAEMPTLSIERGFNAYNYLLGVMMNLMTDKSVTELNETQISVIELIPAGSEIPISKLRQLAIDDKKLIKKTAFYELLKINSDLFEVKNKGSVQWIERYKS